MNFLDKLKKNPPFTNKKPHFFTRLMLYFLSGKETIPYNTTAKFTEILVENEIMYIDELSLKKMPLMFCYDSKLQIDTNKVEYSFTYSNLMKNPRALTNKSLKKDMNRVLCTQISSILQSFPISQSFDSCPFLWKQVLTNKKLKGLYEYIDKENDFIVKIIKIDNLKKANSPISFYSLKVTIESEKHVFI